MNDDGTMAYVPQLMAFAQRFELNVVSIQELIRYRSRHESVVRVVAETCLPLPFGDFRALVLEHEINKAQHVALIRGAITPVYPTPVYIHSSCDVGDVFGSLLCGCGEQLRRAIRMMAETRSDVLLYLSQAGSGSGLAAPIHPDSRLGAVCQPAQPNRACNARQSPCGCGISAQLLTSLGMQEVRLMTNTPIRWRG